jgi:RNA polymerase sigma factor (sigma-70 family)
MSSDDCPLNPADFEVLCQVVTRVARGSGLPPQDAEDFGQHVHVHLIERRYAPVVAFSGRSSLRTYLTVVVRRLLLDWRNAQFGKWRPSAEAKRLGPAAIALDRLMSRDGHQPEEAVAILKGRPSCTQSAPLRHLVSILPTRVKAKAVVPETFDGLAPTAFRDPIESSEASLARRQALGRLQRAFGQLSAEDRRLLELRYRRGLSVRDIAADLGRPDKPLYRQMERIIGTLRRAMTAAADGARSRNAPIDRSSNVWQPH